MSLAWSRVIRAKDASRFDQYVELLGTLREADEPWGPDAVSEDSGRRRSEPSCLARAGSCDEDAQALADEELAR